MVAIMVAKEAVEVPMLSISKEAVEVPMLSISVGDIFSRFSLLGTIISQPGSMALEFRERRRDTVPFI